MQPAVATTEKGNPLTEAASSLSEGERAGIEKALEVVKLQEESYRRRGLSSTTFFMGILNVAATGLIIGRIPEYYWLLQVFKAVFFLGLMIKVKRSKPIDESWCMFDLCWVFAFAYATYGILCVLAACGIDALKPLTSSTFLWCGFWGMANGPLGWSVLALGNALVLHSPEHIAGLFIHISPPFVTWTMRWSASSYEDVWPGVFGMPQSVSSHGFADIFVPAITMYCIHAFFYVIWLLTVGRFHSSKFGEKKHVTVYHATLRSNTMLAKLCGFDKNDPTNMMCAVKYYLVHALACMLAISVSVLFYYSMVAHTIFCAALLMGSAWNGSKIYVKMMTRYYEKRIEDLLLPKNE